MRPAIFQVGGTLYCVILTRDPDTMVLKDADSTPTVAVRKNGASVGDSVTVTKRAATTGIYDCSYNPAAEVEGDSFTLEESATVTGTTTSSATYIFAWNVRCVAVERGTDSANTSTPPTVGAIADAVWDEARADHDTAGTFGEKVAAELDSAARVKLDASQPDYAPAKPNEINAQMLDVLTVDTFQELSSPPPATSSLKDKISWLFMWARNKVVQSTSDRKLYADDDSTIVSTESTVDDGSSFVKGKTT